VLLAGLTDTTEHLNDVFRLGVGAVEHVDEGAHRVAPGREANVLIFKRHDFKHIGKRPPKCVCAISFVFTRRIYNVHLQ
jgi:hypothetical protein